MTVGKLSTSLIFKTFYNGLLEVEVLKKTHEIKILTNFFYISEKEVSSFF